MKLNGILAIMARNPHISLRQIESETSVSRRNVTLHFAPLQITPSYHLNLHEVLYGMDFVHCIEFG